MTADSAFLTTSIKSLGHLIEGVNGEWHEIPQHYLDYFNHTYADGDVSLLPAVSKLENIDFLESWQIDEVLSLLTKVNPDHWPDCEDIRGIDAELLLSDGHIVGSDYTELEYVEDNLGASEKTQKALKGVLESVFGPGVSRIRSKKGDYPSPSNSFLQDKDGTFAGTFTFEGHTFDFEIAPTEAGWLCTYRLDEKSLDKLEKPEFKGQRRDNKPKHRKVRSQGWR
jgi:hypothetical protein